MADTAQTVAEIQATCAARLGRKSTLVLQMTDGLSRDNRYSWCGDYVQWFVRQFDPSWTKATPGLGRQISSLYQAVLANGGKPHRISDPGNRRADVVVLNRPRGGHVGFLWSVDKIGRTFGTMDGNSINGTTCDNVRGGADFNSAMVLRLDEILGKALRASASRGSTPATDMTALSRPLVSGAQTLGDTKKSAWIGSAISLARMLEVASDG